MAVQSPVPDRALRDLRSLINSDAAELSSKLHAHQLRSFPPSAEKTIRRFAPVEAAKFIGIHEGYLRQLVSEGKGLRHNRMAAAPIRSKTSSGSAFY